MAKRRKPSRKAPPREPHLPGMGPPSRGGLPHTLTLYCTLCEDYVSEDLMKEHLDKHPEGAKRKLEPPKNGKEVGEWLRGFGQGARLMAQKMVGKKLAPRYIKDLETKLREEGFFKRGGVV